MRRKSKTWIVPGVVVRVVDGDTVHADLDLGWGVQYRRAPIRLADVNAPELGTPEGDAAAARLRELLPVDAEIMVVSHSRDKYGRVLATVMLGGRNVALVMIAEGHAVRTGPPPMTA